jgi:hypothetical protein
MGAALGPMRQGRAGMNCRLPAADEKATAPDV